MPSHRSSSYSPTSSKYNPDLSHFKSYRGDQIVKKGENVEFFGIIVHGTCFISHEYRPMKDLEIGTMIGQMFTAEFTQIKQHLYNIEAKTDGIIALIPLANMSVEMRKNPKEIYKIIQLATLNAMETFSFNINGCEHNMGVKHYPNGQTPVNRKVKEFYEKNPSMRAFLRGIEKKEEKFFDACKVIEFETKERVIRKDTWDRSILFLARGKLTSFDDSLEGMAFTEGAILGVEQFLFNKKWDMDLFCNQ